MGWRAAKASGNASMPVDEGGSFAQGFASTFVPMFSEATSSYLKEKQDERMLELKESLIRQRPRAAGTATTNRADAKELREIAALAAELGISSADAASLYYSNDGNASRAVTTYDNDQATGLTVQPLRTDDLSSTEPLVDPDAPVVQTSEAVVEEVTPTPVVETAAVEETVDETVETNAAFTPFQVASLGDIGENLSLLTGTDESVVQTTASIAEKIDEEILMADASGATPELTNRDMLVAGGTTGENRRILAAGTRIPEVYTIPPVAEITTLEEANAALTVLNGRARLIGGTDQFDRDVRPMLEELIGSLTELPDLGKMLQENTVDQLREFYERGYLAYEGRADPEQLAAHRERAGQLLNSVNAYPPIPSDRATLQELRNRVSSGEWPDAPTEWLETLNTNFREAEVQELFGDQLKFAWIMSSDRTERELETLLEAATHYLGDDDERLIEIDIALGNPVLPDILAVTSANYVQFAAHADRLGEGTLAEDIRSVGETLTLNGIDVTKVTPTNWVAYEQELRRLGDTERADSVAAVGVIYEERATEDARQAALPKLADVRAGHWESLEAEALELGEPAHAAKIRELGLAYDATEDTNDTSRRDNLVELSTMASRFQDEEIEIDEQVRSYLGAVESSYALSQILQQNPDILRAAGGQLPAIIKGVVGEISVLSSLLSGGDSNVNGEAALRSVSAYENSVQQAFAEGKLDPAARAYAVFQAQEIRLAFQIARMQQGSAGVISNADFDNALTSIRSSNDPNTWADSIRGLMVRDEVKVESAIRDFGRLTNVQLAIAVQDEAGLSGFVNVAGLQERVADAGLADAYEWLTSGNPLITAQPVATVAPVTPVTPVTPEPPIPQEAVNLLLSNPSLAAQFDAKYGEGSSAQYLEEGAE
jgi:hypothetical protein